jgi:hypothetical protein
MPEEENPLSEPAPEDDRVARAAAAAAEETRIQAAGLGREDPERQQLVRIARAFEDYSVLAWADPWSAECLAPVLPAVARYLRAMERSRQRSDLDTVAELYAAAAELREQLDEFDRRLHERPGDSPRGG